MQVTPTKVILFDGMVSKLFLPGVPFSRQNRGIISAKSIACEQPIAPADSFVNEQLLLAQPGSGRGVQRSRHQIESAPPTRFGGG